MASALRGINDLVLAYFFAINLVYTLLLVISVHASQPYRSSVRSAILRPPRPCSRCCTRAT